MSEKCYRLKSERETVDVEGEYAMTVLTDSGWLLISEINCTTGTITAQADAAHVVQGQREREAAAALPEEEMRQLRRQAGGVLTQEPGQFVSWGMKANEG